MSCCGRKSPITTTGVERGVKDDQNKRRKLDNDQCSLGASHGPRRENLKGQATFYRRPLLPPGVAFDSTIGRTRLMCAIQTGAAESFFALMPVFHTQAQPAFCGSASLAMVLNSLAVDPGRTWKGVWRWFSEELLDCCVPLDEQMASGITLPQFVCMSRCNFVRGRVSVCLPIVEDAQASSSSIHRSLDEFRSDIKPIVEDAQASSSSIHRSLDEFRSDIKRVTSSCCHRMVVSYSRRAVQQTGDGHFSPVGAYDQQSDSVLVLDVARFKLPPHWLPVSDLYAAMMSHDPVTKESRGYVIFEQGAAVPGASAAEQEEEQLHPFLVAINPLVHQSGTGVGCCWLPAEIREKLAGSASSTGATTSPLLVLRRLVESVLPVFIWTTWIQPTKLIYQDLEIDDLARLQPVYDAVASSRVASLLKKHVANTPNIDNNNNNNSNDDWQLAGNPVIDENSLLSLAFVVLCLEQELVGQFPELQPFFSSVTSSDDVALLNMEIDRVRKLIGLNEIKV